MFKEKRMSATVGMVASFFSLVMLFGVGCKSDAVVVTPEDVDLHEGATISIVQNWAGLNPFASTDDTPTRSVIMTEWSPGSHATFLWDYAAQQETAASQAARAAAANAPIGSGVAIPDPVYETVTTTGTVTTDALDNAARITLPSYWPQGTYDVTGEENSILWLSRAQYDELVATRSSHISLGLFDSTLQSVIDFGERMNGALATLQGNIAADGAQSNRDITQLTADGDWGEYVLTLNGTPSTVAVITASSLFANYTILANPDNPIVLKVSVKPLSLGLGMLSTLSLINSLAGYHVTAMTY